jgi:methionyl-tRNA formyltransferase
MKAVVAGTQPWTVEAHRRIAREIAGDWRFVQTKAELEEAAQDSPRWIFVLHWHWMIPEHIWSRIETVNMHAAPLPWGRGGNIIEHHLLLGHTETVITAHRVIAALDSGDIYGRRGPVSLAGTKAEILDRFIEPVADLIRWMVETEPEPYPQEGDVVTFRHLPKAEMETLWRNKTW